MKILDPQKTDKLKFACNVDSPLHKGFLKLKTGESLITSHKEWNDWYARPIQAVAYSWGKKLGWTVNVKKLGQRGSRDMDSEYAIIRTK